MSTKKIQLLFFLGVGAIALHFSIRLASSCHPFFSLQGQAKARVSQWEIVQKGDRFALKASYGFEAQEKTWQNGVTLSPPYYLNEGAALLALKDKAKEGWIAWYNLHDPQDSALERQFPFGLLIRTLICYGVLIYFFYLYKVAIRV